MKKLCFILGLTLILSITFLISVSAAEIIASGEYNNVYSDGVTTWSVDNEGVLTIGSTNFVEFGKPTASMGDLYYSIADWYKYNSDIKKIVVKAGTPDISYRVMRYIEDYMTSVRAVVIPDSVLFDITYGSNLFDGNFVIIANKGSSAEEYAKEHFIPFSSTDINVALAGHIGRNLPDSQGRYYDVKFILEENGLMTISGNGYMRNFNYGPSPWEEYLVQIKEVVVEEGVLSITDEAFKDCVNLQKVSVLGDTVEIGEEAFHNTPWYNNQNDGLIYINNSLYSCKNVTAQSVTVKDGTTAISARAFEACLSIYNINLPDTLRIIGERAFFCINLKAIYIPASVREIADMAFYFCPVLNEISVDSANKYYSSIDGVLFDKNITKLIAYPVGKSDAHYTIPSTVTRIDYIGSPNLKDIYIPASVEYIGGSAGGAYVTVDKNNAYYCSDSFGVLFDKNKTIIEDIPLSLKKYVIPNTVCSASIASDNIEYLTIPASVKRIWFNDCSNLKNIYYIGTESEWKKIEKDGMLSIYDENGFFKELLFGENVLKNVNVLFKENYTSQKEDGYIQTSRFGEGVSICVRDYWTSKPVFGVTVRVGDYEAITGIDGIVSFPDVELRKKYIVEYSADGYFEESEIDTFYSKSYDRNSKSIKPYERNPDNIMVSSAFYGKDGKIYGDLTEGNPVTVPKTDVDEYFLKVNADWGKFTPGTIELYAEKSGKIVKFDNNKLAIKIGEEFDAGETFKLKFTTGDGEHTLSKKINLKTQAIPDTTNIDFPEFTSDIIPGNFPFFGSSHGGVEKETFKFGIDLDKLIKTGNKVDTKLDGEKLVITVEYGGSDTNSLAAKLWGDEKVTGNIGAKLEIPINDLSGGKWAGYITYKTANKEKYNKTAEYLDFCNIDKTYWIATPIGTLPVYLQLDLSAMADAELGLISEDEYLRTEGSLEIGIKGRVSGGLGISHKNAEITVGPYGSATAKIKLSELTPTLSEPKLEPSLGINFGVQLTAKAWIINAGADFEMGKWTWPDEDESKEIALLMADCMDLSLFERDYKQNPNEFAANNAVLFSSAGNSKYSDTTFVTNVIPSVQGRILEIGGKKIFVYIDDNEAREIQNGLTLMYSVENDGIWSEPIAVYDDNTMDSQIYSDGNFVIWENTKIELQNDENDWNKIMSNQEIAVAKYTGSGFERQIILTNNSIADFSPVISEKNGNAVAAWLTNSKSDIFAQEGITSVCYSVYDGAEWSDANVIENVGNVTKIEIQHCEDEVVRIVFINENGLNIINIDDNAIENIFSEDVIYFTSSPEGVYVYTYDGKIQYVDFNKTKYDLIQNIECAGDLQVVQCDNVKYLLWTENSENGIALCGIQYVDDEWSGKVIYFNGDFDIVAPVASPIGDNLIVSYVQRENVNNLPDDAEMPEKLFCNLNIVEIYQDFDIAIEEVTYLQNEIKFNVTNKGSKDIESFTVSVLQEETIASETIVDSLRPGETYEGSLFVLDFDKTQEGTIKVELIDKTESNYSNNVKKFNFVGSDPKVVNARMIKNDDGTYCISTEIANDGVVSESSVVVEIRKDNLSGEVIYSETHNELLPKEKILIQCDIEECNTDYYVCVLGIDDANGYNNYTMCYNATPYVLGDINGDGTFDYYDVSKLYAFFRNKTTLSDTVDTDINGDGIFDYYDVSKLYAIHRNKATFN